MMKSAFFIFYCFLGSFSLLNAQKLESYKLEKLYQPEVSDQRYLAWQSESILIPLRFDSEDKTPVTISQTGLDSDLTFYLLHPVWADFSAGNCGETKTNGTFQKTQIPDRAEKLTETSFTPVSNEQWVLAKIDVPSQISPGIHPFTIMFNQKEKKYSTKGDLVVLDRKLGQLLPSDFYTDFWQFPISVADFHQEKPWSSNHWKAIDEMFGQLAQINQHSITTSVFWDLYNTKIRPAEEMMIQVRKEKNGNYSYDYTVFDRYVELGLSHGINNQIAIHNLFPWNNFLFYKDESSGEVLSVQAQPGTSDYQAFWKPLILDLTRHLEEKGWLSKALFFIDERDPSQTLALIQWVKSFVPQAEFGFSGDFYPTLSPWVKDYSMPMNVVVEPTELSSRILHAGTTSLYTSCFEQQNQPNLLMTSDLREIYFLTQLSQSKGYNGMLRWAFNLWSNGILDDAIYSDLPSGDAHLVYPNGQVSLRYLVLEDALEELSKLKAVAQTKGVSDMSAAMNRYFLINIESDRYQMIQAMKNYLND